MPDRKKLLQDFYAKYAPDQELSDERLKAINTKYGEDNDRLLQDFYTKYAPNEQVTPERLDAIYGKYGLKKKEPTQQAGALGAMPSRSASSGNLQEMLAAAPPLPADARLDVPIGAQPQRPQERAITTALPPIGNIPLRTEEQRTEERRALYEPSQVSKRLSNFAVEMTTVLPAIEQWQTQAGNAMLGRFAGKEANEAERAMMIAQEINLQDLESKLQEGTEGEIIQSIKKGDIPALAFGIFDASMGILRSGIVGGLTMGAGIIPDMMAQSTRSFNKSKAEALGVTPEQLIEQGKEEVAIPTIIGAIGGSLELVGLKGITSAITKKIGTKLGQQVATGLMGTGGEGITEWTQAGLERANESLGKGKSVADATNDAVELMFSEEGLEAALKGMTGAGATIAAGRGIRALTSAKAKIDAGQPITAQEAQEIAVANIESNGAVAAALENMVNLGAINQEQAQIIGAEMEAMSNAAGKVPSAMAASAPQLAPIILEKQNIDARIAELNVEMATKDESFAPLYKMEIRDLEARKAQLNEQIQAVITLRPATPQAGGVDVESTAKALETDSDGNFVPKKYTLNRKGENPAPNIPISAIDKESSALEDVEDVAQVKLLEIRGKNSQGQTVGTVWIQKNDGQSYSAEVFFNDAELKAVESILSKEQTKQAAKGKEGVQEGGVDTRIASSPLAEVVNKRGVITDSNGNLVEGDVYVEGERVVLEAGGKIYDTLGSIDELSQMTAEQLPVQVVAPRIIATEGGFTYNSDAGVMPQGTRVTPQGTGLKAVKRDKNGNVKSVVVKDDAGNTFNLKGEDAQAMAFELMMDEISKGNLDAKIVLNDEAATAINTAGRPATTQAADSGATQADATRQGAATSTTATERGDGGRGSRVEATQETEAKPKAKPDAAKEPSTKGVDARKQAEDGEGVGKEDTKGKEATQEGEVADKAKAPKDRLAEARERKKAAIDVLKNQMKDAKNIGAFVNFEQRLKEDKEFFGAIRDIIRSNIEIGVLTLKENIADIAQILGIDNIEGSNKRAFEDLFNKELSSSFNNVVKEGVNPIDNGKGFDNPDFIEYDGIFSKEKASTQSETDILLDEVGGAKGYHLFYKGKKARVEMMSPDEYLKRVRQGFKTDKDENILDSSKDKINKGIERGDKIDMPSLRYSEGGKFGQEGRNRAVVARERGERLIPVLIEEDASMQDKIVKAKEILASIEADGGAIEDLIQKAKNKFSLHRDAVGFMQRNIEKITADRPKLENADFVSSDYLSKIPRGRTFHERLSPDYYNKLKLKIDKEGIKEPIILRYYVKDDALRIADGHHRLKIAKELGIKDIPVKINVSWSGSINDAANQDIFGQNIFPVPTKIDVAKYRKRDYFPSNVSPSEIGIPTQPSEAAGIDVLKTPKEKLAEVRDRKKAAIDVLKTQWQNAKNTGISTDFEQRLKDDKAFFGAIRDIIQSNIEIGALKITDSLNDIADALGIKLSKADKDAIKGVFNKEVLRSLKSEQAERFETEAVRDALSEYIEENKQVLKGAANAQALKLVNEASTEAGFNRALKYIDKLIDSAEFRDAVNAATDAVSKAPEKLSGFAQIGGLVKAIAKIKVRGIEDLALLKKMAEILSKPTKNAPFELQNLVNEVNDYLTKKADPEGLSTQEDVLKEFKKITTERVKNEEGEIETRPKTLDTARKIKNYAQRIAEIEAAMIDVVQDEAVMEDLRAKIEAEKTRINEASVKLKEEMEESRIQNILFTKAIINVAKAGDMFSDAMYKASIKPIQQTKGWEKIIDSADYYTSVKYRNAFEAVAAGYLPRYLFRDITIPLTNFGKVEGAIALSEAAKPKIKDAAKEVDTQPKAFNSFSEFVSDTFGLGKPKDKGLLGKGKQLTKKDIVEKMQGKYAQYIDAMYGLENEAVFLDNFLAPTQNAFEAKDNAVQSVMDKFYKDAGISQASMILDATRNTKLESFYKVFYHLLQNEATANGKSGNILKEQLDLIKESSVKSSIPDFKLKIIERISNKYPKGVEDKNLTIGEKKMVKAFKDALNTLKPLQEQANIRRGLDFNAVSEYVPHMALDYSFTPRDIRGETLDFEQTDSMLSDAGNVQYKNPKIKSDRGISRVETPTPFVYNPDITTILGVSANQVLTDYYLFPQIYGANRAFTEATKATGSAMPDALRTRYGQMIRMQGVGFKGKAFRAVGGVLKAAYANVLARPIRIAQEMIGGIFNYKATGKHGKITRLPKDLKDALMLSKDGSYKAILDLARKDAYTDVVEFEDGLLEKAKSIGKKAFDVGTSPDAINDGTYRRAHMVSSMRDKFKEITGEDINFNKAASDPEYQAQYKDALKEASTYAYNQTYVKYYSKGRLARPARPLSLRGHYLYDTTSQGDVAVLADRMLFVFGQYAHRMSQLFHQRLRDGVTDNNYGRTVALSSVGGFLMTAVSYQLVKEFRNYLTGDDEEKKKAEFRFKTTMTSPDYYVAQLFSAFSFFAMGQYGSIGRGMAYLAAYQYSRALKEYKGTFSKESVAEFESTERALNNAIKDLTFYQLPSTDYGFKSNWLEVTLGGGSFLAEEASKIINEVSNLALDAANGDVDAQKAMYVAGFLYNATLSQRTGITIPMLKDLRDREKNLTDQQMTPEALKKKLNKDSRYASQIFEDVALKAALEVVNNKKSNEEAFNDAYELISQALPDMDEEDRDSKLTKQFTKMLMPTYLHTIDKEQKPEVRGLMFREKRDEVLKSLNEAVRVGNDANIDKYEKMQQELETYYLENYDNEKFVEGFSIPDAKGN